MIRVLHLTSEHIASVRVQRYLQSNINMGIQPVFFCRLAKKEERKKKHTLDSLWIPDRDKVLMRYYKSSDLMTYLLPVVYDEIDLKKVFKEYKCDLIHAHNPEPAYYSFKLGLPTVFDDADYWQCFLEYWRVSTPAPFGVAMRMFLKTGQLYHLQFLYSIKRKRFRKIVGKLIQKVPVIGTNEEAELSYRKFGARCVFSVPNVPLNYEREYAFAVEKQKKTVPTTCYVGNMKLDDNNILRNTAGVRELWEREHLGHLHVFEGKNYVAHLEVLRKIRECHFNLLFWKPLAVHRYYLQNKAFLASVVGVPTIISSSLKATINLLGEYALPVSSLSEIPNVIRNYDYSKKYSLNPAHLWEYYEPRIKAAYQETLNRSNQ